MNKIQVPGFGQTDSHNSRERGASGWEKGFFNIFSNELAVSFPIWGGVDFFHIYEKKKYCLNPDAIWIFKKIKRGGSRVGRNNQ